MDKYIQKLISQGDQHIALKELLKATKGLDNPKFHQEAVHLSARWEANQQEKRQGTTSSEDYNITQAQITAAILELTQRLPENLKGHSQSILQSKWVKWSGAAVVFIGVLAGLAKLSGYSLKDLFTNQPIESFSVSVLVLGKEGRDDKILTNGKAILDIGGNRIEEEINSQGEAIFPALRKE
ncbi:MAG: hypothetical protein KDD63_08115, partial [Bacteroidetes bacterium]|nr:hypothetical protein [Bacteroidota bacterium]